MATKRNYRANLAFVEAALRACWGNAQDLVKGAKLLLDNGLHAQALSLSVLALEELGKLFCIDGLLFARTDDHKAAAFAKSLRSHALKLEAILMFPLFLGRIAAVDPRYGTEKRFASALAISIRDLQSRGNAVLEMIPDSSFQGLDHLKQQGLYARPTNDDFVRPAVAVRPNVAEAVYGMAWRASSTLDFVFRGGNLDRYIEAARGIRAKATEVDHQSAEAMGQFVFDALFSEDNNSDSFTE